MDISHDILHHHTGTDHMRIRDFFSAETGYLTPKVEVRAAVFDTNRILLIREKVDGLWAMPGGWADIFTSLRETVLKECMEEAGASVKPRRIVGVYDRRKMSARPLPFGVYKIIVECAYLSGEFQHNPETFESGFFSSDDLPPLSQGRTTRQQIDLCFAVKDKEHHEAFFD
jgi:ADP-ribose pyrophosphatase YjhB (NUDIX family)